MALIDFTQRLISLRKLYPMLRAGNFLYGQDLSASINDLEWWDERGEQLSPDDWNNAEGRALVMRRARRLDGERVETLTLLLNASPDPILFQLPPPADVVRTILIDSAKPDLAPFDVREAYEVEARGAALLNWTTATAGDAA
jgi:glycogen operon protein